MQQTGPFRRCREVMGVHSAFLAPVTLTFDLDIQTRPSEGPNTPGEFGANLFSSSGDI